MDNTKHIPDFSKYSITSDGIIFNNRTKRQIKQQCGGDYMTVNIFNDAMERKTRSIHRLVACTYIPNPDNLPIVNHKDGDKLNNNVENFEWCTHRHNNLHARKNNLQGTYEREVVQIDSTGKEIASFKSLVDAMRQTGIDSRLIGNVCRGRRRTAGGYHWRYENNDSWTVPTHRASKKVEKLDEETGHVIKLYSSAKEAAEGIGANTGSINNVLKGRLKTLKGFKWRYAEITENPEDPLVQETRSWKTIDGYTSYRISPDGRVYSERRNIIKKLNIRVGYRSVGLSNKEGEKVFQVHILVAKAYVKKRKGCDIVNHKNGNRSDNRVENLKWCTYQENAQHAHDTGLSSSKKKVIRYTFDGERGAVFDSIKDAARSVNLTYHAISRVAHRRPRAKTAGSYVWRFEGDSFE
uniref:HNH endonuclease n=1 Tax=Marseillevirus LCMAC102 TaxID=2506603 RepID=A0A481YSM9_9VIRU|nr:MAG: HNH endonuclease [Marseillevirus LCMAC102]